MTSSSKLRVIALLALLPFMSGCWVAICCGFCIKPRETIYKAKEVGRRIDPRRRAEHFKQIIEEGSLEERDFGSWVGFVVTELRLKDVLQVMLHDENAVRTYRVQTVDGFAGPSGGSASGRLEIVPDYGVMANEGVKTAFGIWGKLIPDKIVLKLGRDLANSNRYVAQFLDVGIDESDLDFFVKGPSGEIALGKAITDVGGRATVPIAALDLPDGAYPLSARIAESRRPIFFTEKSKVLQEDGGLLFVRRTQKAEKVLILNVSNTVFALEDRKGMQRAMVEKKYDLRDSCTAKQLKVLAKDHRLVFLSGNPEGMAPLMREELVRQELAGAQSRTAPVIFKPMSIALEKEKLRAFKTETLTQQKEFWGAANVVGYLADDLDEDGAAAKAAGVPYFQLPKSADGGWCAGITTLLPATTP